MDIFKTLILIKNNQAKEFEDKTVDISSISTNRSIIAVTYISTSRAYNYNSNNVRIYKVLKVIELEHIIVCVDDLPIGDCAYVIDFGDYIKIIGY